MDVQRNDGATPSRSPQPRMYWLSVKMTARLDVNATPGGRMSPIAAGIVPECSGASRVKRAARAGFAALDAPCALWYSMLVGERERSGAPGIRVFMRAPCSHGAHAAASDPARVGGEWSYPVLDKNYQNRAEQAINGQFGAISGLIGPFFQPIAQPMRRHSTPRSRVGRRPKARHL